jgi:CHAT domain-containing protein/Tfp pilus assembly protein PilF
MFASILKRAQPWRSFPHLIRLSLLLVLTLSSHTIILTAQGDKGIYQLELNKPLARELTGGQSHSYGIALIAGQYLHVIIDQRGIDVVVTLFDPDGKQIVEVDSPNGAQGPEPVFVIAETSGTYRLEVRSLEKDVSAGHYEVKIAELRKASEQDKNRITAEKAFVRAELLRAEGAAEALQSAIKEYGEALPLYHAIRDFNREAMTLNSTGLVYGLLGDQQKALDQYEQALPLRRAVRDRNGEADTLNNIGGAFNELGERQKALDYYVRALQLYHMVGDRYGEAVTLNNIGYIYHVQGDGKKALDYYVRSLQLRRAVRDYKGEARTLNNIGLVYDSQGERQKALVYYQQALPLARAGGDRPGEAVTLASMAAVYRALGEQRKALDLYQEALPVLRAAGNPSLEAKTFTSIGSAYYLLGEQQKALDYYEQALPLCRAARDRAAESDTLNNIGLAYSAVKEWERALEYYGRALVLARALGDRDGEARTFNNVGLVYSARNDHRKALEYYSQALPTMRVVGDRDGEANTLYNLMSMYSSLNMPRLAIFYGKQSANVYQRLRSNIQGVDNNIQKTYLKSVERTYRGLAVLLTTQGRASEAQQVLDAFKDQQFFDFDKTQTRKLTPLVRTPREKEYVLRYEKAGDTLGVIGGQVAELRRRLGSRQANGEEAKQLQQLESQLKADSDVFSNMLSQAEIEFSKPADEKDKVGNVSDTAQMQAALRQLKRDTGQTSVAVYTLVGEMKFHALIVTPEGITSVSSLITDDELNKKARELWGLLQSDAYDPTTLSHDLYNVVFKPIEEKLPRDTRTILWSLDGNLRYVPMAALYDGRQYLVERYNHVYFTRADRERMTHAVKQDWTATGLGASGARTVELLGNEIAFGDLPGVSEEMRLLVKQKDSPQGLFEGETLQDAQFTRAAMLSALRRKRPLVHIASHFSFRPGDEERSFLLMGDGTAFTLAEMKQQGRLFYGVEMLTLSACNTAAQLAGADGREVDAFAELAQRLGANAVMATLWPVADNSTPWLMREFYRTRLKETLNKAEALRQAQLALLRGRAEATPSPPTQRGAAKVQVLTGDLDKQLGNNTRADIVFVNPEHAAPFKKIPGRPFAHPFYWSPFVLIGNWR